MQHRLIYKLKRQIEVRSNPLVDLLYKKIKATSYVANRGNYKLSFEGAWGVGLLTGKRYILPLNLLS